LSILTLDSGGLLKRIHPALTVLAVVVPCFLSNHAAGDEGPPGGAPPSPNANPFANPAALFGSGQGASFGFGGGRLDGDFYIQATSTLDLDLGPVGLGLGLPLNLLAYSSNEPPTRKEKTYANVLRKADWPKPDATNYGRYLALIRFVRFGQKGDPLFVLFGQMSGSSIGHGSIIDRYNNTLDVAHPRRGLALDLNFDWGGIETLVNDVAWPSTNLLGVRTYVRPFGFGEPTPLLSRWAVGVSVASDRRAPLELATADVDARGEPCSSGCRALDASGGLVSAREEARVILGVDTEIEVLRNSIVALIPYLDFNRQAGAGNGLHVGTMANFRFPVLGALKVWSRLEVRFHQAGYIPSYFDALYDLQRFEYPVGDGLLVPKALAFGELGKAGGWKTSLLGEATAEVLGVLQAGATLTGTPGVKDSKSLMLFGTFPKLSSVKVSAYYLKKNFDAFGEVATFDERSVAAGALLVNLVGPLYLSAVVNHRWTVAPSGDVVGTIDYNFGVQTYFAL
jgi:hypothetical protein